MDLKHTTVVTTSVPPSAPTPSPLSLRDTAPAAPPPDVKIDPAPIPVLDDLKVDCEEEDPFMETNISYYHDPISDDSDYSDDESTSFLESGLDHDRPLPDHPCLKIRWDGLPSVTGCLHAFCINHFEAEADEKPAVVEPPAPASTPAPLRASSPVEYAPSGSDLPNRSPNGYLYPWAREERSAPPEPPRLQKRWIFSHYDTSEHKSRWKRFGDWCKELNPLLASQATEYEVNQELSSSVRAQTLKTTHFKWVWQDGHVTDLKPLKEAASPAHLSLIRSLYKSARLVDVNMPMFTLVMKHRDSILCEYIAGDSSAMKSTVSRVNFVVRDDPNFSNWISDYDVYANTICYAINCLVFRYVRMFSALPKDGFAAHFHKGPVSRRQRPGPSSGWERNVLTKRK